MSRALLNKIGATLSDLWGRGTDSEEEERSYREKKPPELDKLWLRFNERLNRLFGRKGGGGQNPNASTQGMGIAIVILIIICVAVWLVSGLVVIAEGRVGLVTTFGKYTETKQPGLSWRWPYPIQSVEVVNLLEVRKVEIGYRASEKNKQLKESLMPTSDGNIVDLQVAVQYRLKSGQDFAYNNTEPEEMVKQVAESAIREVVGKNKTDYVLYEGRDKIAAEVSQTLQSVLDRYSAGILVTSVSVQGAGAPEQVHAAADDAQKAEQDRKRMESEAKAYADDVVPKAKGVASRLIQDAEAYRAKVIAHAEGDTARFKQILAEYQKAPTVTRDRMYIETMQHIFTKTTKIMVDSKNGKNMMYLPIDKLMSQVQTADPAKANANPNANAAPAANGTAPAGAAPAAATGKASVPGLVNPTTPASAAESAASKSLVPSTRERDSRNRETR